MLETNEQRTSDEHKKCILQFIKVFFMHASVVGYVVTVVVDDYVFC